MYDLWLKLWIIAFSSVFFLLLVPMEKCWKWFFLPWHYLVERFCSFELSFSPEEDEEKKNNTCAGRTFCLLLLPVMSQHNFHWSKRNFVSTRFSFSDKKRNVWHVIVFYMLCLFVSFFLGRLLLCCYLQAIFQVVTFPFPFRLVFVSLFL